MSMLFSNLAARFISSASKHLKPSTIAVYAHYFRKFLEFHGDIPIEKIRPIHVNEFARTWHDSQAIKRLFSWAKHDAGMIEVNPVERCKHPPKGQRKRIMTRTEMLKILRESKSDLRALLFGYRETFARPDELRRACWEDIQSIPTGLNIQEALQTGTAVIVLSEYKDRNRRPDPSAPRVILLSPRACSLLLRIFRRTVKHTGPIFLTESGRSWTANALRCRFRRLRTRLKIQRDRRGETIVPYTFRHTGATKAAASGVRDRVLADVLGHTETSTTRRYQHLANEHLHNAMSEFWRKSRRMDRIQ